MNNNGMVSNISYNKNNADLKRKRYIISTVSKIITDSANKSQNIGICFKEFIEYNNIPMADFYNKNYLDACIRFILLEPFCFFETMLLENSSLKNELDGFIKRIRYLIVTLFTESFNVHESFSRSFDAFIKEHNIVITDKTNKVYSEACIMFMLD